MFESLMEAYKNMDEKDKRNALINEVKKTIGLLQNICEKKGIPFKSVTSKEILDLNNGNESINDYLEAMFVYIMYLEELMGSYIETTFI